MFPNVHIVLMGADTSALRADGVVTFGAAGLIYQNNMADIALHFNKVLAIRRVQAIFPPFYIKANNLFFPPETKQKIIS